MKGVSRRREKKGRLRRDALPQKRIAPSQKERPLTPRCPWGNRGVSVFYDPAIPLLSFYAAVLRLGTPWERRTLVRLVFSFSERSLPLAGFSSVFSVPSVRTLFF